MVSETSARDRRQTQLANAQSVITRDCGEARQLLGCTTEVTETLKRQVYVLRDVKMRKEVPRDPAKTGHGRRLYIVRAG